ncbi:DNA polymerase delta subunit 2 [Piedraia hortae CBS 480.64]|uniref:DNA-directed DNA polymerase n=1 Tax=Piedraia hortae CBS 480.64 TaxID=1314780 RepID=A0A6A7BRF4_9PEZI|nr:DNA polymerase delta subunit 2 [Piedraia hortae CBS 480.64]
MAESSLPRLHSSYKALPTYRLPPGDKRHYQQQYADMYFTRLAALKPFVERNASAAWEDFEIAGETAHKVDRVLDVRQGELCWVVGTVFMEMPLKPLVLDDIGKEHWIAAPPPRVKYIDGEGRNVMLEDESGRLRLTGPILNECMLTTGAIVAVIGTENKDGEFEVLEMRLPDLPQQPARWQLQSRPDNAVGKVAIVSGLGITGDRADDVALDMLMEYLLGEAGSAKDQENAASISRLIIAGNSLAHGSPIPSRQEVAAARNGPRKYGYDSSIYNPAPVGRLDAWLSALLPSLPVTLIPGERDPTETSLPQPPMHPALFQESRAYMPPPNSKNGEENWFDSQTNPTELCVDGFRVLATGGQPVDDVYRYIDGENRLGMMESMLRWRLVAPTAPDTLWCYPFQDKDRFVIKDCPHVFVVGNQPRFETQVIVGPDDQTVRMLAVPNFNETGQVVLLDMQTLEPEVLKFEVL